MADPRLAITRRELGAIKSEKTIVLALLIQLFIAAFSSFLVVGLVSLYAPGSVSDGQVVTFGVAGDASDRVEGAIREVDGSRFRHYDSRERAESDFEIGRLDGILLAHYGDDGRIVVETVVPRGSLRSTLIVTQVRETLETLERTERVARQQSLENRPISLPREVSASPYFGFTYTILLPLLCFLPVFISGSLVVDSITEENERGTLELLRVAPLTIVDIVDGKLLAAAVLAPAQVLLWLALLTFNGIAIAHVPLLLAFVAALTLLVVSGGAAISILIGDRQRSQLAYSTALLLFFGSLVFLPEHPSTTVARLAIDSAAPITFATVGGAVICCVLVLGGIRAGVAAVGTDRL
ncbi:ABC transporter permease [Haladaptatus sp. GCM10025707]|uniref:ABC transporter permease n=1 Tax=unclassified Haladaptatus TaxID=2622732 RepID=UPI0023E80ECA|nr:MULTISPECIES: ABC transporter permease [unclassified Haladaptatus]